MFEYTFFDSRSWGFWHYFSWFEYVVQALYSISKFEFFGNIVFEVVFEVKILNSRRPFHINKTKIKLIVVVAVDSREVREEFIGKQVIPTQVY